MDQTCEAGSNDDADGREVEGEREGKRRLSNDLFIQASDDSQCIGWTNFQLTYFGKDCIKIPQVLIKLYGSSARRADFSFCSLQNLDGLESFSSLEELILDNNQLDDSTNFPAVPQLITLSLNKNKFTCLDTLIVKLANSFPNLKFLSLLGNNACPDQLTSRGESDENEYQRYRFLVVYRLPKLNFLDSTRVTTNERESASRIGKFVGSNFVIRPAIQMNARSSQEFDEDDDRMGTMSLLGDGNLEVRGDGGSRRRSSIRRESRTLFHPLSNLIPATSSDLITITALPQNDPAQRTELGPRKPEKMVVLTGDNVLPKVIIYVSSLLLYATASNEVTELFPQIQPRVRHDILYGEPNSSSTTQNFSLPNKRDFEPSPSSFSTSPFKPMISNSTKFPLSYANSVKHLQNSLHLYNSNGSRLQLENSESIATTATSNNMRENSHQLIREALTSGSASLSDVSAFLNSQASRNPPSTSSSATFFPEDVSKPADASEEQFDEQDDHQQKIEDVDTTNDTHDTGIHPEKDQQVKQMFHSPPSSFGNTQTSSNDPVQSPRPPNIRAPQVVTNPFQRHWANKHAWFATRRPILRPFGFLPMRPHKPPGPGKFTPSGPRGTKHRRPVDYVRERFPPKPKRRNMYPHRRPTLFPGFPPLFPSAMQSNMGNAVMYPTNTLTNWFMNSFLNRRPLNRPFQGMQPSPSSALAFPFPSILSRLPPSLQNSGHLQNPRLHIAGSGRTGNNQGRGQAMGGIKTSASSFSPSFSISTDNGMVDRGTRNKFQKRKNTSTRLKKGEKRFKQVQSTSSEINWTRNNGKNSDLMTLPTARNFPEFQSKVKSKEIRRRPNLSIPRIDKLKKLTTHATRVRRSINSTCSPCSSEELINDLDAIPSATKPIVIPVSSYWSIMSSSTTTAAPQVQSVKSSLVHRSKPLDLNQISMLDGAPTFHFLKKNQHIDHRSLHHHHYYNDRSDDNEEGEHLKEEIEFDKEKAREEAKAAKEQEKMMKKMQEEKEKKFYEEKGNEKYQKKTLDKKKKMNGAEIKKEKEGKKDDNYKSKEKGKLGVYWFKDSGHKKHGWKNVYHKEEWGDSKKFHDIFHDKDWKKKWKKWDNSKEKSKGSKWSYDKEQKADKTNTDSKKIHKNADRKWKHDHGSGFEKKQHHDKHSEHHYHDKAYDDEVEGKNSKGNFVSVHKNPARTFSPDNDHHGDSTQRIRSPSATTNNHGRRVMLYDKLYDHPHSTHHEFEEEEEKIMSGKANDHQRQPYESYNDNEEDERRKKVAGSSKKRHNASAWKHFNPETQSVREGSVRGKIMGTKGKVPSNIRGDDDSSDKSGEQMFEVKEEVKERKRVIKNNGSNSKNPKWNQLPTASEDDDVEEEDQKEEDQDDEDDYRDGSKYGHIQQNEPKKKGNENKEVTLHGDEKVYRGSWTGGKGVKGKAGSGDPLYRDSIYYVNRPSNLNEIRAESEVLKKPYDESSVSSTSSGGSRHHVDPFRNNFRPLLVSPPTAYYQQSIIPATTTIYGPTSPIMDHQVNSFQNYQRGLLRTPGLAFLSMLRSRLPLSSTPLSSITSYPSSFSPSSSTLFAAASSPTPTRLLLKPAENSSQLSSFSYHLQQLQKQKAIANK